MRIKRKFGEKYTQNFEFTEVEELQLERGKQLTCCTMVFMSLKFSPYSGHLPTRDRAAARR